VDGSALPAGDQPDAVGAPAGQGDSHRDAALGNVQADGSMDVRYELDWNFGEKGRHGIDFRIVSRESWDPNPLQDVVYEIDNVEVSSPSGAPAQFTERVSGWGSDEELVLRIGDPDVTLDTSEATYVISYRVRGAMRTFDGFPELQWDIVSGNYPPIEQLTVTVTGPDGVTRAGCASGAEDCAAEVRDGAAHLRATDVDEATTAYVQLSQGSVDNAEPILERRRLSAPELQHYAGEIEVATDGTARVEHTFDYELPAHREVTTVRWDLVDRLPWSDSADQEIRYSQISVVDETGRELPWTLDEHPTERYSFQSTRLRVELVPDPQDPETTVTLSYVADGAVGVEGHRALVRLPMGETLYSTPGQIRWTLPGEVSAVSCSRTGNRLGLRDCYDEREARIDGNAATVSWVRGPMANTVFSPEFAADTLTDVAPLQMSLDRDLDRRQQMAVGGTAAGVLGMAALGFLYARRPIGRPRDRRYAQVAPGLLDPQGPTRAARMTDQIPVSFTPPEVPLHIAGLLLDRRYRPRHLTAVLVDLAARDLVELQTDPVGVKRTEFTANLTRAERAVVEEATESRQPLSDSRAQRMRYALEREQDARLGDETWFRPDNPIRRLVIIGAAWLVLAVVGWWLLAPITRDFGFPPALILAIAGLIIAGFTMGYAVPRPALMPAGRAMRDQVEGFRRYLRTAEAAQLSDEADRDIFRRYLPWAVLFDEVDRWARIGSELVAAGRIDPPRINVSGSSLSGVASDLRTFTSKMATASAPPATTSGSSGGSGGGSSGFSSSGGGGGGGGGGTSASSW